MSNSKLLLCSLVLLLSASICTVASLKIKDNGIFDGDDTNEFMTVWPKPQSQIESTQDRTTFQLASRFKFQFNVVGESSEILTHAIERYRHIIFYKFPHNFKTNRRVNKEAQQFYQSKHFATAPIPLDFLNINVTTANETLSLETDESYTLLITRSGNSNPQTIAHIVAPTVYGAMHALETFAQLVKPVLSSNGETEHYILNNNVVDKPRFQHRGSLIDTSRHYLPLPVIFQQIEALSYNKYNVLHWHIVDDESFPYQSKVYPLLSEKGAYDPLNQIYTHEDIKEVIKFAKYHGVRVVAEFDTPGHTDSWGDGYPELLTQCYSNGKPNGQRHVMYPISNYTYSFIENLFKEISNLFEDQYFHIGGDEVSFSCWESNPDIVAFMKQQGWGSDYSKLEQYYETNILQIAKELNQDYIVWQEIIDNGLQVEPSTVVEVWKNSPPWQQEMYKVTAKGLRAILSTPWYLNYISYGEDWTKYYAIEPLDFGGSSSQQALVMGGEMCMWGEFVDGTNSLSRTWPRGSAVGERLWSAKDVTSVDDATPRIHEWRCKMLKRGIPAEPPNGPSYCDVEWFM